jgi:chromosome segregation ATPase
MPWRILSDPQHGIHPIETDFDAISLYPENPAFRVTEVHRLQQELTQAIARLEQLPFDLDRKDKDIVAKNSDINRKDAYIEQLVREMDELIANKNADIEKKNQHIDSLGELFETASTRVKLLHERYMEQAAVLLEMKKQLNLSAALPTADSPTHKAA